MESYWYVGVFMLGSVIGSFLNVLIYRLRTGRSLNGRSHCMSCRKILRWFELLPVLSYLALRARCRHCSAYIPLRYLMVECATGVIFAFLFWFWNGNFVQFSLYAALAALLIVIVVYDLRHTIIPNGLTILTLGVVAIILGFEMLENGSPQLLLTNTLGAVLVSGFFYGLWKVSRGRWIGLGDAKLAFPLALLVDKGDLLSLVVLSFWIGAGVSLLLIFFEKVLKRGKTNLRFPLPHFTMKSEVPFAPFLVAAFVSVHFFHADIFVITSFFIPPSLFN